MDASDMKEEAVWRTGSMLFNSYVFLMVFLPITCLLYYGLNRLEKYRMASFALLAASFVFYGYQDPKLCLLLAASILLNYAIHLALTGSCAGGGCRALLLVCGLAVNLGILFYFKYLDFFLENVNALTGSRFVLRNIALPLGISFYTFQQLSFVVDSYRGETKRYRFLDYALFVSFFPQLVAGPIVLHSEIIPQFADMQKRKVNYANLLAGTEYLIIGLAKKVLLADSFGRICDAGHAMIPELSSFGAIAVILSYTLEIYFDFSGYCDMAVGIGRLFNIEIPVNFRSPYKAVNIADFWKRWHITLTRFLTTYLYIPLGGSRKGKWKTCRNVLIVFALSGLWHGADWSFVVWGMMHGVMMVLYRLTRTWVDRLPKWFTWLLTFVFVNAAWMFFWTESIRLPLQLFRRVFCGGLSGLPVQLSRALCDGSLVCSLLMTVSDMGGGAELFLQGLTVLWLAGGLLLCVAAPSSHEIVAAKCRKGRYYLALSALLFTAVIHLSEISKFIYFNF